MEKRTIIIGFIVAFIALTLYIGFYNNKIINTILTSSFWVALSYYILTRIDYLIILISFFVFNIATPIKEFISGVLFIWAVDIVSFPRLPTDKMPIDPSFLANSDTLFMNKLIAMTNWAYPTAWKFYYIFLPLILIIVVIQLLGIVNFGRFIRR